MVIAKQSVTLSALAALLAMTACQSSMRHTPTALLTTGDYGRAREHVARRMTAGREDRQYLLDRMKLAVLTLADGYPDLAQPVFEQLYDVLRTQGINADKTVASVVINEDIKFWKGEPFEQALAMFYYGLQQAQLGHWDNARAAAQNSLFSLRDFGADESGQRIDTLGIAQRALEYERAEAAIERGETPGEATAEADYLNTGYAVRESNFTAGYLLNALANQQLARQDEANDNLAVAVQTDPNTESLVRELRGGRYNTLLVVSFGLGPAKVAYGPDNALAQFAPRFASDGAALVASLNGASPRRYPTICDVNRMALDHMWNNLEDVRLAKSTVGDGLLLGGAVALDYGLSSDSDAATYAGLAMLLAGAVAKAGAHADTRYCDALPQRLYVVPLHLEQAENVIELQVDGAPSSGLVLRGLGPPDGMAAQLRYVRLVSGGAPQELGVEASGPQTNARGAPPVWAASGEIYYSNDETGAVPGPQLPFVLGGRCVRTPTELAMGDYQRSGHLPGMTLSDLREVYREERISFAGPGQAKRDDRHVLEGGRSLACPMAGTAGFARLFGQTHAPYQPRSDAARQLFSQPVSTAGASAAERH